MRGDHSHDDDYWRNADEMELVDYPEAVLQAAEIDRMDHADEVPGASGQDRESYTDDQDRTSYTVSNEE